jgi:hypothetical protein
MSKPDTIRIDDVEYVRKDATTDLQPIEQQRKDNPDWPWKLGQKYMIRTVTFHDHGVLVGVTEHELVLQKAAWIADSGRWWNFITGKTKPNEVEPFHPDRLVIIGRGAVIDATQLDELFGEQK